MKSMNGAWVIAKKDFRSYFSSPIAYLVMAVFLFLMGWMFSAIFENFLEGVRNHERFQMGPAPSINTHVLRPLFGNMNVVLLFVAPFITMRLFAEEKKNNTIELLFTAPVTWWEIILGKFFSAFGFVLVMLALTLPMPLTLAVGAKPDWAVVFTCYLGTIFMAGIYVSVGMWCSSLTENQIVAGILSFGIILFLWIIKWAALTASSSVSDFFGYLSIVDHFEEFSRGVLNTKNFVFFFSAIGLWLFLTYKSLESYSWRS